MKQTAVEGSATSVDPVDPRITVLVMDEDADDLRSSSSLLEQKGFDVRACGTCAEALRWLQSEVFDFIIVSQGGPNFEGRSVLERAIEIDRRMPVLVLARHADIPCYIESVQSGALDYFEKPLAPQELLRLVKSHLRCRTGRDC
jgi:two-component system C4-dicarboxylate transport response regulator DctD